MIEEEREWDADTEWETEDEEEFPMDKSDTVTQQDESYSSWVLSWCSIL